MAEQLAIDFTVRMPALQLPAPSVASRSSEDAADRLDQGVRNAQHRAIMRCLAPLPPGETLSRYEIHRRTGIAIHVLCARLKSDLVDCGYVECVERARPSHVKPNLKVNGYRLSPRGRASVQEIDG